ncbi:hypothetical protein Salat_0777300 [Sesamum alatum]|uniref:Bet v I/Major latex protein domain-containing protein n=1 Tax=Sesamum alatum TaxID=300844 RepID=A0AAE1YTY2_9LAMI|nr:hypothetical protein Salat_0777300 [Sesamum alatum]
MMGRVWDERDVKVPASKAWKLYGSPQLGKLVKEALPNVVSKIDVVEGDGSAGTILHVVLPSDETGNRDGGPDIVQGEVHGGGRRETSEGGGGGGGRVLDLGFTLYRVRTEVIEKEGKKEECVVRESIEYELKEEAAANAALVSIEPLVAVMQLAADYLTKNYNNNNTN